MADQQDRASLARSYVSTEIASARERIGDPPAALVGYLGEHAGDLDSVRSVLLGDSEISWEVDVSKKDRAPWPNVNGIVRLERLLLARTLLEARAGTPTEALATIEACWRLNEALSSRPELISQIVAAGGAKFVAGVLRKIDAPAYGWPDRLRSGDVLAGVIAAFENQIWQIDSDATDLTGQVGAAGRLFQRVGEAFREGSRCGWTDSSFQTIVDEAAAEEPADPQNPVYRVAIPDLMNSLFRAARFEVDAELTALVLDARIEREALRRRHWPDKLQTVGNGVCSEEPWSYKALRNGTVRIAFEGRPPDDSTPNRLPLEFFAGTPLPSGHRRTSRRLLVHRSTPAGQ